MEGQVVQVPTFTRAVSTPVRENTTAPKSLALDRDEFKVIALHTYKLITVLQNLKFENLKIIRIVNLIADGHEAELTVAGTRAEGAHERRRRQRVERCVGDDDLDASSGSLESDDEHRVDPRAAREPRRRRHACPADERLQAPSATHAHYSRSHLHSDAE